jgi:hypothetical protein
LLVTLAAVGLAHAPAQPAKKPRFLPAETKLMSEKRPQASFSN